MSSTITVTPNSSVPVSNVPASTVDACASPRRRRHERNRATALDRLHYALVILGLALVTTGCSGPASTANTHNAPGSERADATETAPSSPTNAQPLQLEFADISPILAKLQPELGDGVSLESWTDLMRGGDNGGVLIPFDSKRSLAVRLVEAMSESERESRGVSEAELGQLKAWIDSGAPSDDGAIPYADAENLLYACNQGEAVVSIIDMDANVVIRTVDLQALGFAENSKPHHVAVEADGSFWYLSLIGAHRVLKFTRDNELVGQAEFESPGMLVIHPTDDALLVGRSMSAVNPPARIGRITRSTLETEEIDVVFPRPHALAIHPDGEYAFTASLGENSVATIDDVDLAAVLSMPTHHHADMLVQFAISPDGSTMIGGGEMTGRLLVFDLSDLPNVTVADSVEVGTAPWHPIITRDGSTAYFANKHANEVTVLDLANREVEAVIRGNGISMPHGSALSPDERWLYISNNNLKGEYQQRHALGPNEETGTIVVFDTESNAIAKVLEIGAYPTGLGTRPAQ